jgi:hypothetical protein
LREAFRKRRAGLSPNFDVAAVYQGDWIDDLKV